MRMGDERATPLLACHDCDRLHRREQIASGAHARCGNCGASLYRHHDNALDRATALYLAAFVLLLIANAFPFLSLSLGGLKEHTRLFSCGWALWQAGMGELGLVVFLTSVGFPLLVLGGMLYLLLLVRWGIHPPAIGLVYRVTRALEPWSLMGVFMLGTLISAVKLLDMADVIPGPALFALIGLLFVLGAARSSFDPEMIWLHGPVRQLAQADLMENRKWVSCHCCGLLRVEADAPSHCPRCGGALHRRLHNSLPRTWALLATAVLLLIPANLYPIMTVRQLGQGEPNTIISGVIHLIEGGWYGLALIVFFASVVVPLAKIATLAYLSWCVERGSARHPRDLTRLYRVTEAVGAWSMVDVFLVGLLVSLVSLGLLASVTPGVGVNYFAGAVILTIIAAHSFDPRLIWDRAQASKANQA